MRSLWHAGGLLILGMLVVAGCGGGAAVSNRTGIAAGTAATQTVDVAFSPVLVVTLARRQFGKGDPIPVRIHLTDAARQPILHELVVITNLQVIGPDGLPSAVSKGEKPSIPLFEDGTISVDLQKFFTFADTGVCSLTVEANVIRQGGMAGNVHTASAPVNFLIMEAGLKYCGPQTRPVE